MATAKNTVTPEVSYPATFRKHETDEVLSLLASKQSLTLVGMKRVGVSNFLRFLANHPEVNKPSKGSRERLFVYLDANDLTEISLRQYWLLLLKRLVDASINVPTSQAHIIPKRYDDLVKSGGSEDILLLEALKEVVNLYAQADINVIIILARFDRLLPVFSEQFFGNLQSIIETAGNHISYVFTSYLPFHILCPQIYFSGSFSMFAKPYYLLPAESKDSAVIVEAFEKQRNITLPKLLRDPVIKLAGGHVQLLQLCLVVINEEFLKHHPDEKTLLLALNSDERILLQCDEIFESLTKNEQQYLLAKSINAAEPSDYLIKTGIIESGGTHLAFSPIFNYYLQQKQKEKSVPFRPFSQLTRKESALLTYLNDKKSEICTRDELIGVVWPEFEDISDWALDQLVSRLRKKLDVLDGGMHIVTNRGQGYQLVDNDE